MYSKGFRNFVSKMKAISRSTLSVVLALCMLAVMLPTGILLVSADAWDGTYEMFGGSGTVDDPYQIGNVRQLMLLSHVASSDTSPMSVNVVGQTDPVSFSAHASYGWFTNKHFVLTADIDLSSVNNFAPIGAASGSNKRSFACASFDGQGHTVSGLTVDTNGMAAGFFGKVYTPYAGATIKNLHVSGSVKGGSNTYYVGGLLGQFNYSAGGTGVIENCSFTGTVQATRDAVPAGGLMGEIGMAYTGDYAVTVKNSFFNGTVTGRSTGQAGGLVGYLYSLKSGNTVNITDCYTTGTAQTGSTGVGGLLGFTGQYNATDITLNVRNCRSDMTLTGTAGKVSGLIGYANYSKIGAINITNSHFAGSVASQVIVNADTANTPSKVTLTNVYYRDSSYTADAADGALTGAAEKTSLEFANGTVTDLLNNSLPAGSFSWQNGSNGYPIHGSKPEVTGLTLSCGEITFDPAVYQYELTIPLSVTSTTVTATAKTGTTLTVNNIPTESGVASGDISLPVDETTVITVIGDSNGPKISYTITITHSAAAWDGTYQLPTNYAEENAGTATNPYQIGNLSQLMLLSKVSNSETSPVNVVIGGDPNNTVEFKKSIYGWFQGKNFVLTADIDLSAVEWAPLGGGTNAFACQSFDGQGHTVKGLTVNTEGMSAGFFGTVYLNGDLTIKNLHVSGSVKGGGGSYYVGGLIGRFNYGGATTGLVENCSFTGTVESTRSAIPVGGLIGQAETSLAVGAAVTVNNCYFDGTVTGSGDDQTGGLIGDLILKNPSTVNINDSYTTGAAQTGSYGVGGLVGRFANTNTSLNIHNCWSDMTLTGTTGKVSGMVGYVDYAKIAALKITNSHFAGTVASQVIVNADTVNTPSKVTLNNVYYRDNSYTAAQADGALTGAAQKSVTEFASGTVRDLLKNGAATLGGMSWRDGDDGYPIHATPASIIDLTVSRGSFDFDPSVHAYELVLPLSITSIKVTAVAGVDTTLKINGVPTESGVASADIPVSLNQPTVITIVGDNNGATTVYTVTVTHSAAAWDGTYELPTNYGEKDAGKAANPYKIGNLNQLMLLSYVSNSATSPVEVPIGGDPNNTVKFTKSGYGWFAANYFVLTADIDLSGVEWTPLGGGANAVAFNSFDGQGHTISGMKVDTNGTSAGFIGQLNGNGSPKIKNLHVSGSVKGGAGTYYVGGLVGRMAVAYNTGTVENCSFTGTVVAARNADIPVGGLVGQVERSGSNGTFTIANCRFDGDVTGAGTDQTGGLIGLLLSTGSDVYSTININGCYTTGGEVKTGSSGVGGIVGLSRARITANIVNCWSDMTVTGTADKQGGIVGYAHSASTVNIDNCYFAGETASQVIAPELDNITLYNVFYRTGSYTAAQAAGALNGAAEKSVVEFANGTVTALLNNGVAEIGGNAWNDNSRGTPVLGTVTLSLQNLLLSDGKFTFDPSTKLFTNTFGYSQTSLFVIPTAPAGVTITVNGQAVQSGTASQRVPLAVGSNTITIKLTKGGNTTFYAVRAIRNAEMPGVWDGSYEPFDTSNGKGTDLDNPIIIENAAQLAYLAAMTNGETVYHDGVPYTIPEPDGRYRLYADVYFKLGTDLQLNPVDDYDNWATTAPPNNWTPIGFNIGTEGRMNESRYFGGVLDGNNHTITGLYCVTDHGDGTGLFGSTGHATVRNLHIEKGYVEGLSHVGGLVGKSTHHTMTSFISTFQNCSYSGIVKAVSWDSHAGGLVGSTFARIDINSCWTEGTVIGGNKLGGLIGQAFLTQEAKIVNSYSVVDIVRGVSFTPTADNPLCVAGLIGKLVNSTGSLTIRRSYFAGSVPTDDPIIGNVTPSMTLSIDTAVFYRTGSIAGTVDATTVYGAKEYSAAEFADGTVTALLNDAEMYGDFWNWEDGANGYPVSDGVLLVTDYRTYTNDAYYNDGNWYDAFVNKEGGTLKDPNNSNNNNGGFGESGSPITGETSMYIAAIVLLLISGACLFLLVGRKRREN